MSAGSVGDAGRLAGFAASGILPPAVRAASLPCDFPFVAAEGAEDPGIDEGRFGLWAAAGLHRRAFGRRAGGRLISAVALLTPSWRVEHSNAVATLVARDAVSLATWASLAFVAVGTWIGVAVLAATGQAFAVAAAPFAFVVALISTTGTLERVSAWRRTSGLRRVLVMSNVAADPKGVGHGARLLAAVARFADCAGYDLVLLVDPANDAAMHLYRGFGFVATGGGRRRVRMHRAPCDVPARLCPSPLPSWLLPVQWSAASLGTAAIAAGALCVLYWGTPAVWLMPPTAVLAALAAENDWQSLRIPNRLTALGAAFMVLTIGLVAAATGFAIVAPAVAGAAIFGAPLLANHALSHGGSGLGDAKLAAVLGLAAGAVHPGAALGALLVSLLLGSAFGVVWLGGRRGGFPLAPALAVGTTLLLVVWAVLEGPTTW